MQSLTVPSCMVKSLSAPANILHCLVCHKLQITLSSLSQVASHKSQVMSNLSQVAIRSQYPQQGSQTFEGGRAWVEVHQLHCLVVASRRNQVSPANTMCQLVIFYHCEISVVFDSIVVTWDSRLGSRSSLCDVLFS